MNRNRKPLIIGQYDAAIHPNFELLFMEPSNFELCHLNLCPCFKQSVKQEMKTN
jgi:hypothetical protein